MHFGLWIIDALENEEEEEEEEEEAKKRLAVTGKEEEVSLFSMHKYIWGSRGRGEGAIIQNISSASGVTIVGERGKGTYLPTVL